MALFGPPDIDKLEAKGDIKGLEKALTYPKDKHIRSRAARALGRLQAVQSVKPLIAALKDEENDVQISASIALGEIKDPRVVEPLIAALQDSNGYVQKTAAEALGKRGAYWEDAALRARAVQALIATLKNGSNWARENAAAALGKIGDKNAVPALIAALKDRYPDTRSNAAWALGWLGDAQAVEPLIAVLAKDEQARPMAVEALGMLRDPRSIVPLLGAKIQDYKMGEAVNQTIKAIGAAAVEPLIAALHDGNWRVRQEAAEALHWMGDTRAVKPLVAVLKDEQWIVRSEAAKALGHLGDAQAVEPLVMALRDGVNYVRISVAAALDEIGWEPESDEQKAWYFIARRAWAECQALGGPAVEPLMATFRDGDDDLRQPAVGALADLYRSGRLDVASRQKIFSVRDQVKQRHTDEGTWDSACQMYKDHTDVYYGAKFDFSDMCVPNPPNSGFEFASKAGSLEPPNMASYRARLIGEDAEECLKAVMELMSMHNTQAAETIIHALPDSPHQGALGTAIGMLGAGLVVEPLLVTLTDQDARLRANAAMILGIFPDTRAIQPLTAALDDENEEVRSKARKSLEAIKNSEGVK